MPHPKPTPNPSLAQNDPQIESSKSPQSLVVVDAAVNNYQYLLASPLMGMDVHILTGQEDGMTQLQALLPQYRCLSRLHLICKGAPGLIQLGTTLLSEANLWAYADDLRQWRHCLSGDAEIFIYGCDLASTRVGQAFVSWLGLLTSAGIRVL